MQRHYRHGACGGCGGSIHVVVVIGLSSLLLLLLLLQNGASAFTPTSSTNLLVSIVPSIRSLSNHEIQHFVSQSGTTTTTKLSSPLKSAARAQQQQQQPPAAARRHLQQRLYPYPLSIRWMSFKPQPPRHPPPASYLAKIAYDGDATTTATAAAVDGEVSTNTFRSSSSSSTVKGLDEEDGDDILSLFTDDKDKGSNNDASSTLASLPRPDPQKLSETVNEQRQLYEEAEERVTLLQGLVEDYQEQLEERERLLRNERDSWSIEKIGLLGQVAEWTKLVQSLQQDQSQVSDTISEQKKRQEGLQEEINGLKAQLKEAQGALVSERDGAQQLKARMLQAEDQLEFEQMRFQKEKEQLLQQVNSSKSRLDEVEKALQQSQQKLEVDRKSYQKQLQEETSRLQGTQAQLDQIQKEFNEEKAAMEQQMKEQRLKYLEAQDTLGQEQTRFEEERVRLESMVQTEQTKLRQLEQRWKRDQEKFNATQQDLEMKIVFEKNRVVELANKLEQELDRFAKEKTLLQDRLEEERTRLMEVQAQLAEEQLLYQEQKADLEYKLSEEIRIGQLKKRQMNNRFESIRKELTALWQGAKREARIEKERLTKKYEEQLEALALNVQSLEQDLTEAVQSSEDIRAELQSVQASKSRLQQEYNNMELRYRTTLAQRNLEIADLQNNVSELRGTLRLREETLEQYETSFREIAKLGWNLGKKRAKKTAMRVRGWVTTQNKRDKRN